MKEVPVRLNLDMVHTLWTVHRDDSLKTYGTVAADVVENIEEQRKLVDTRPG